MTAIDRLTGLAFSVAFKAPCRVATTGNITLNGLQTIDGVALAQDDRVLVKDQTNPKLNGIYAASSSTWARDVDFAGPGDCVPGTLVAVVEGSVGGDTVWQLTTTPAPIIFGTANITFRPVGAAALLLASPWIAAYLLPALTQAAARDALDVISRSDATPFKLGLLSTTATYHAVVYGVRYDAFPRIVRLWGGKRLVMSINSSNDHVGSDEATSIKVTVSDESGKEGTWSTPVVVLGGTGLDCTTNCLGVDRDGRLHLIARDRESGNKIRSTSLDGVTWTTPEFITSDNITKVTGGSSWTLANFRFWGKPKIIPDQDAGLYLAGYWLDGVNAFETFYCESDASGRNWQLWSIATSDATVSLNESAIVATSATERLCFTRHDGTSTPFMYKSTDSGRTWTYMGAMDIPKSGGWLVQEAEMVRKNGRAYVALLMGTRRSTGGTESEPYPSPSVQVWYCPVEEAMAGLTGWKMGYAHTWPHDPTYNTDSYCSMHHDDLSGVTSFAAHDELSNTRADCYYFTTHDIFTGPRTPDDPAYVEAEALGEGAYLDRHEIIGYGTETLSAVRTIKPNEFGKLFINTTVDAVTLPLAAACPKEWRVFVKARGAAGTYNAAGSDTINGGASLALADGQGREIRRTGDTSWESF